MPLSLYLLVYNFVRLFTKNKNAEALDFTKIWGTEMPQTGIEPVREVSPAGF